MRVLALRLWKWATNTCLCVGCKRERADGWRCCLQCGTIRVRHIGREP
jgi:hypothetical protein